MIRNFLVIVILALMIFVVGCGETSSAVSGSDDATSDQMGASFSLDLAIDNDDSPIVAYTKTAPDYNIFVWKYSGGAMVAYGANPVSGQAGFFARAQMAPDGALYLAYKDGLSGYKASVKRYWAGVWSYLGGAGISTGRANYTSIAIDSAGVVYAAFVEAPSDTDAGGLVVVKKYDGSNWLNVGTQPVSASTAYYVSLAIDPATDDPYVSYVDYLSGMRVVVRHFDGSAWGAVGVEGLSSTNSRYSSLGISSTGNVFVAYEDGGRSNKESIKNYLLGAWATAGSSLGVSEGEGRYTSLAISVTGAPTVAYVDQSQSAKVCVMQLVDGVWQYLGAPAFSPAQASWTDIEFDSTGTPYVVCRVGDDFDTYLYKYNGAAWEELARNF